MRVNFFCPRWGSEHLTLTDFVVKVKEYGYDGIETGMPESVAEQQELLGLCDQYDLLLVLQHWEVRDQDFETHKNKFIDHLNKMAMMKPYRINSHTGRDYFSFKENKHLIAASEKIETIYNVPISHETHRGRFSFAAHVTEKFLKDISHLRLTFDVSHWFCVAESLLEDQNEAVKLAISRTDHIHARVGYEQGPQVIDFRDEHWADALTSSLNVWDAIIAQKKSRNEDVCITTEFGPEPYLIKCGDVDQWTLNTALLDLLRDRYGKSN